MSLDQGQIWAAPVAGTMTNGRTDILSVISVEPTVLTIKHLSSFAGLEIENAARPGLTD